MPISRRNFLWNSLGAATIAGAAAPFLFAVPPLPTSPVSGQTAAAGPILLNENENAYGASQKILQEMQSALARSNRYPYPATNLLAEEIAHYHHVSTKQVMVGCGSTEILRMCAQAFLGPGRRLIMASPTYETVGEYAKQMGAEIASVRLNHRYEHDLPAMQARVDPSATLIYICNPNNPTGTLTPRADLEAFLAKLPSHTYVLIDEAYHHYAGSSGDYASFLERPVDNPRVIVARTFSKVYGLAGMRAGYGISAPSTIAKLAPYKLWAGLNTAVARAAVTGLRDSAFIEQSIQRNANDRQEFFNAAQIRQLKPLDSHTNFYMMDAGRPAREVIGHFQTHNILIGREFPPMLNYVRVTLGLPVEMQEFWRVWDLMPAVKMRM